MRKFWQGATLPILTASEDEHRARRHPQSKTDSQLAGSAKLVLKKGQERTTHSKIRSLNLIKETGLYHVIPQYVKQEG